MKKTIVKFCRSNIGKTIFFSAISGLMAMQPLKASPVTDGPTPEAIVTNIPNQFRAVSYIMQNSLVIKVHMENPAREKITIQIRNSQNKVVYQKYLGKTDGFIGKYNMQEMPNGSYTLVIKSTKYTHSQPVSLQTFSKRTLN